MPLLICFVVFWVAIAQEIKNYGTLCETENVYSSQSIFLLLPRSHTRQYANFIYIKVQLIRYLENSTPDKGLLKYGGGVHRHG